MVLYIANSSALSGEPGAYPLTGSLIAFGTLKNPLAIFFVFKFESTNFESRKVTNFSAVLYGFESLNL
jgi:hypothetical protein